MVSYVLLVVIAVGLSVLVYNFLRLNIGTQQEECPAGSSLIIRELECSFQPDDKKVQFGLQNTGLFTVEAAFIRMRPSGRDIGFQINTENEFLEPPITPGNISWFEYSVTDIFDAISGNYELTVQPATYGEDGRLIPCQTIISQPVQCS